MKRLGLLALVLGGCATAAPPAELLRGFSPERSAFVVAMAMPPADTYRLVVAAFASEGLTVGAGDAAGGWLVSSPQPFEMLFGTALLRCRAIVIATTSGSEVAVSVTAVITASRALISNPTPSAERTLRPTDRDIWWQAQRVATYLRYRATSP